MKSNAHIALSSYGFSKLFPQESGELGITEDVGDLVPRPDSPIFASISDFVGVEYVGYTIEKERFLIDEERWKRISKIKISGYKAVTFKDTRVSYGSLYRYRIKSMLRHTFRKEVVSLQENSALTYMSQVELDRLLSDLDRYQDVLDNFLEYINQGATDSIAGREFSLDVGNFTIVSNGDTIRINRRDANSANIASVDLSSLMFRNDLTYEQLKEIINNILKDFIDSGQSKTYEYVSEYYESNPSRSWVYANIVDEVGPRYPSYLNLVPHTKGKNITVLWQYPSNPERDIIGFNLYRKRVGDTRWQRINKLKIIKSVTEVRVPEGGGPGTAPPPASPGLVAAESPFPGSLGPPLPQVGDTSTATKIVISGEKTLLVENVIFDNFYVDMDVEVGEKYTYGVTCFDSHGLESALSSQIQAQLNPDYNRMGRELDLHWVSGPGVPLDAGTVKKKFQKRSAPIVAANGIKIKVNTQLKEDNKAFILRVKSLDTHQEQEIRLLLKNLNITEAE